MRTTLLLISMASLCLSCASLRGGKKIDPNAPVRVITVADYVDKMRAAWIGQMAGVGWGGPTEFKWKGAIIPEDKMPKWEPGKVNQFNQDDIYVEMTFLRTLELYGLEPSLRQAGLDFANSGYNLWHANRAGRDNLRSGIAPPDSGHPEFNTHADDIDYQIEADFSGIISPGMPNEAVRLGEIFGRLMNYGDGLYGGQFVGGMYAEAYFENDVEKIVRAGLACVPAGCQFHECISDVLKWWKQNPDDWQKTWELIEAKYDKNPDYRRFSCKIKDDYNIDAKINAAYIVMGLLYGNGDLDQTMVISTRCGQDSDCNPSNSGGVLFTTVGFSKLPERFTSALDPEGKFSHTPYNFPTLVEVCEKLARQTVERVGGRVGRNENGEEVFIIPIQAPRPSALEICWEPGPAANSRFTEEEMKQIVAKPKSGGGKSSSPFDLNPALAKFAPGWKAANCGDDMSPGLKAELRGRQNVLLSHPLNEKTACVLSRKVAVPEGKPVLRLVVGHHEKGDWQLIVKADGKELKKVTVGAAQAKEGWLEVEVDLAPYAEKEVALELHNQATAWSFEAAYWAEIGIENQ